jgi:hypothetical protein
MIRRIFRLGLILVCGGAVLPGCETLKHETRPNSDSDVPHAAESTSESKESGDSSESTPTKGFFKSSRLSGAMSSEGRDIERSLGVQ